VVVVMMTYEKRVLRTICEPKTQKGKMNEGPYTVRSFITSALNLVLLGY
jgi:hypothetical protein